MLISVLEELTPYLPLAGIILIIALPLGVDTAQVDRVIDGDTLITTKGRTVRLLGIDTPEKGEACYEQARGRLQDLTVNKHLFLVRDRRNKDIYNRYLRHIFTIEGHINKSLVEEGYAQPYVFNKDWLFRRSIQSKATRSPPCQW